MSYSRSRQEISIISFAHNIFSSLHWCFFSQFFKFLVLRKKYLQCSAALILALVTPQVSKKVPHQNHLKAEVGGAYLFSGLLFLYPWRSTKSICEMVFLELILIVVSFFPSNTSITQVKTKKSKKLDSEKQTIFEQLWRRKRPFTWGKRGIFVNAMVGIESIE